MSGNIPISLFRKFCGCLHFTTQKQGYQDIILDFENVKRVFESFMMPVIAAVALKRHEGVDFDIVLPQDDYLCRVFINANWAHYLCPEKYTASSYVSDSHVSAMAFHTPEQQYDAVDRIMELILARLEGLNRGHLKALYWSLTEITDNVLNHSESPVGGFVQATAFAGTSKIEFIVSDGGVGIPRSLGIQSGTVALEKAIQEGVTRNRETNQGNGLFGTYQIAALSEGEFEINSSNSYLTSKGGDQLKVRDMPQPYQGTAVRCVVDCTKQDLLEKALRFGDKPHDPPFDYVEKKFETDESDDLVFRIEEHSRSLGSRNEGTLIKNKIINLLRSSRGKLTVDFDGVFVVSSSFADEVFGKIFADLGPVGFMSKIELVNIDPTVRSLIDRAISQRLLQYRADA